MSLKLIQQGAQSLGYDIGRAGADGLWGRDTEAALRAVISNRGKTAPRPAAPPAASNGRVIQQGSAKHLVDEIVLHCSATHPNWMADKTPAQKTAEIRRWHVEDNKWRDIGYHYVIDRNGSWVRGRLETVVGAGVEGHNAGVIHICLIGGHGSSSSDAFSRHFTQPQDAGARALIADISSRTPIKRISGHNEWARKACPGFNVPAWLNAT